MSYKSIEQALRTLLPTHADDLPQELVKLAANLLAQSRSCCSTLKAEEEIARPYACAEIACKRYLLQFWCLGLLACLELTTASSEV
jgi:origin recognition complex subunit 6